jgi:hypothetical protein
LLEFGIIESIHGSVWNVKCYLRLPVAAFCNKTRTAAHFEHLSSLLSLCYNHHQWKRLLPVTILESNGFRPRPTGRRACNNPVDGDFPDLAGGSAGDFRRVSASSASRELLSTSPSAAPKRAS